jgi:hypothetical protein
MTKLIAIALLFTAAAHAGPSHCQRNGGPEYACHICTRGHNAMTLTEYECSAKEEARQERDRMQRHCMVYLPDVQDAKLRAWCRKQSEKMP